MSEGKGGLLDHKAGFGDLLTEEQMDTICVLRRIWRTGTKIDQSIQGLINVDCLKGIRRAEESGPVIILLLTLMFERGAVPRPLFPRMLHVLATYMPGATPQSTKPPFYHEKHEQLVDLFLKMYEENEFPEDIGSMVTVALQRVPDEKVQTKFRLLKEARRLATQEDQALMAADGRVQGRIKSATSPTLSIGDNVVVASQGFWLNHQSP